MILGLLLALASAATPVPDTSHAALLTFEDGTLAAVDWIDREGTTVHTRSVLTRSNVVDATITLRADGSAAHAHIVITPAGGAPAAPIDRSLGEGASYWSDMIPSSIEQAILRARALNVRRAYITATSLYSDTRGEVDVERLDATDWVLRYHGKRYLALTDSTGHLLAATLPEHGVTIERRAGFAAAQYALWPPNAAAPGAPYRARAVAIRAPQGHVLAGTLTTPLGSGPFPAAVLITGLSPHNRNNGDPPWMPLRDFADALSRAGIAVLRVDDRGVGASTGDHAPSTTEDEADDVRAEVRWLRAHPGIEARRVALVGYSEGGLIAPMVAAGDSTIAAIVTLAGPGVPGVEVARYQTEAAIAGDTTIAPADREAAIAKALADSLTPREQSYLALDPIAFAQRVRCPALIVQGANDLHVPLRSAERLAWAMREGGNRDVTVRIFPGVSHSLLPDPNGLNSGWPYLPAFHTAPPLLDAVAQWSALRLHAHPPGARTAAAR